jgi:5-hydroxyisourate hydrolase-like protein (transthyretin family)
VKLEVFDSEGKMIEILIDEEKEAGTYEIEFDAVEKWHDPSLQSETYYYQLIAGDYKSVKKMLLSK